MPKKLPTLNETSDRRLPAMESSFNESLPRLPNKPKLSSDM